MWLHFVPIPIMLARSFHKLFDACRIATRRSLTTSSKTYPYSQFAIIPAAPAGTPRAALRQGKGLMAYLQQTLPSTEKQKIIGTLFSKTHPDRVRPGSVLTVNLTHAPTSFTGVLIAVRRRGPDTSFVLRNVVQRTGVEMQFFVNSPHVKEVVVVSRVGGPDGKKHKGLKKAKLYYLRDSPERMTAVSATVR
jgi:large subunit ribosomal protein L19